MVNGVLFLGLKEAFDSVNHWRNTVCHRLVCYFSHKSYLTVESKLQQLIGSGQDCYVNGVKSAMKLITFGVPQGSI